jgi:hypothetical protein
MMKLRMIVALGALGLVASAVSVQSADAAPGPARVLAQKKAAKPAKDEKKPAAAAAQSIGGVPKIKGKIGLTPKGLHWNMNLVKLSKIYELVYDKEFLPLYKKTPEGGPQMKALDAELEDKKQLVRRNVVDFGSLPTGVDQSALKGEYSYGNGESYTHLTVRSGTTRNFFFFKDRLWKIYDEHKLRSGGPYGENWEEAVKVLTKKFGIAPKLEEPDYARGKNFQEAHWTDGSTYIRAVNREPVLGLVWADAAVQTNLAKHRPNRPANPHAMDKDVVNAVKKAEPPPEPEEKPKGKGKAKK